MILVTKPFLPPVAEYQELVEGIWQRQWLTNNGPLVNELELQLKSYLQVPHLLYVANGTVALQLAIKALGLTGEIITTPFSYVATTSSILWENCTPVFADIDPHTLTIDPNAVERAITPRTSAILATHVYGNACDIDALGTLAQKHNLRVIYDAAHAFGTQYRGKSVFEYGDISTTSFHATKLFHTVEGGGVFTSDAGLLKKLAFLRNFGHNGPEDFAEVGINAKNSEFHAAMGLVNLRYISQILASRKDQSERYDQWFEQMPRQKLVIQKHTHFNYAYYPLIFKDKIVADRVFVALEANKIFARRYFYPSLDTVNLFLRQRNVECHTSRATAACVLCLPLYFALSSAEQDFVARIILREVNNA